VETLRGLNLHGVWLDASIWPRLFSRGNLRIFATTFRPKSRASIRPRLFSRGNSSALRLRTPASTGFNSATAFQPWKPGCDSIGWFRQGPLQFGHRFSAVETG